MSWNRRFTKDSALARSLLHVWNAFLCSLIGFFLLAIGPTIVSMDPDRPYVAIGLVTFVPFIVASIRSGGRTLTWWRHPLHALVGLGIAYLPVLLPIFAPPSDVAWGLAIGFSSLILVSWLSDSWRAERRQTAQDV